MSDEAKAAIGVPSSGIKSKRNWTLLFGGHIHRVIMRLAHQLGFCYPERTYASERGVWCHWCGMRGSAARIYQESE